jgi:hypothetical protein
MEAATTSVPIPKRPRHPCAAKTGTMLLGERFSIYLITGSLPCSELGVDKLTAGQIINILEDEEEEEDTSFSQCR